MSKFIFPKAVTGSSCKISSPGRTKTQSREDSLSLLMPPNALEWQSTCVSARLSPCSQLMRVSAQQWTFMRRRLTCIQCLDMMSTSIGDRSTMMTTAPRIMRVRAPTLTVTLPSFLETQAGTKSITAKRRTTTRSSSARS